MGSRPTTNPRRGIIRATVTVLVLTAMLVLAILVVSSLGAPSAKAPTSPLTPGPITPVTTTSKTSGSTTSATASPSAKPAHTAKKKTLGSRLQPPPTVSELDRIASGTLLNRALRWGHAGIEVRSHNRLAWFTGTGHDSSAGSLVVQSLPMGRIRAAGAADPLVKPVWSPDGRFLLYVTSHRSAALPGVRWTLMQYDFLRNRSTRMATLAGFSMTPLGWWRSQPLFLAATGADTSLYSVAKGRVHFLDVLAPQVITSAALSVRASSVAFVAPTNCYNCTLEFFNLRTSAEWNGPSGVADESQFAWSGDGRSVVTVLHGRIAVVQASPGARVLMGGGFHLANCWQHSLFISATNFGVKVYDRVNGLSKFSAFVVHRE